ncbi:S-adenosyl-L-methionine-dependent methyltransferase [Parathielavia appendiculata]|uniref:catechol O-methyltransferase n=1 Tax=Parathielavia appendiculata TaxID=2587402 RepID=A0AAN6U434_9PEZI|nr:S-adenosyl-L-methionine-dependent methyltransferase [Parathielavia appendiculata]
MAATLSEFKRYKPWEVDGKFFGDGREVALLDYVYGHPELDQMRGSPAKVCQAIDAFARSHTGLINVGLMKGAIVTELIARNKPSVMLELGGYVGYSAILFGDALRQAGGSRFFSVEKNPLFAAVAASLIDLAGLRDTVRVVVGTGAEGIQRLHGEGALGTQIDMAFFDHHKPSYTNDLKLCERLGLIGKGTVLVADNMILPGNPEYAAYVRASVAEKLQKAAGGEEMGNPNLEYVSRFVPSYEPSGEQDALEITECTGIAA